MANTTTNCVRTLPQRSPDGPPTESAESAEVTALARMPWTLRVGTTPFLVRPTTARDLTAVALLHRGCSPRSLLDRYRRGGRPPGVAALELSLRRPLSFVVAGTDGGVVAHGVLRRDRAHDAYCAELGLLVADRWQRLGIGSELVTHLAGAAHVAGYHELIAYPATAVPAAQRLLVDVGRTRMVPDVDPHLHTYLSDSAALGLGSIRQRLAG